ncbi:MAG: nucleotidyltransferase domain-containing protein [Nanoarchaeota archaeon]
MKKGYNLLILKALGFFIDNPYNKIYLREFSRKLKISLNSAQRFLNFFLEKEFIQEKREANLRYFKANLDSIVFRNIKLTFSLEKINNTGILNNLKEKVFSFVLFGSVAEGKDDLKSDYDFLMIGKNKSEIKKIFSEFEDKFSKEINLHLFTLEEWKNQAKINKAFYQDIISKGVCLIGEKPIVN